MFPACFETERATPAANAPARVAQPVETVPLGNN
jgi:hypothetical protein